MPDAAWRKKYIVQQNEKDYLLYAGLLDLAHEQSGGRLHIHTQLIQVPGPENGHAAIVFAEAKMADEGGVILRSATGLGDADATNVKKHMQQHMIRLAETRAKARALRDLTNSAEAVDEADDTDPREPEGPDGAPTPRERDEAEQRAYEVALARWDEVRDAATAAGIAFKSPVTQGASVKQLEAWTARLEGLLR